MTDQSAQTDPWRAHYAHACDWALDLPPLSLPDMFAAAAAAHGDKPLVDFLGREFSYAALYAEARAFADGVAAGRAAYESTPMPEHAAAQASTTTVGMPFWHGA